MCSALCEAAAFGKLGTFSFDMFCVPVLAPLLRRRLRPAWGVLCLLGLLERPVASSANNDQQCLLILQSLQRAVERRPCAAMIAKHSAPEIILSLLFRLGGELAICAAQQVAPQGAKEEPSVVVKLACTDLVAQIGLAVVEHVEILKGSSSQSRSRWAKALSMHSDSVAVVRACCQSGFVTLGASRFPFAA